jgi:GNAT superfamily N-acetyltransferase
MAPEITLGEAEDAAFERLLEEGLGASNEVAAGAHGYRPLTLSVHLPGAAAPVGGLYGGSFFRWMFIKLFHLPPELRRQGLGSILLARAEAEARARGCVGIHLDTFSFQARPFYEKHGFRLFGTLEDFPPGHRRYFMCKRLDASTAEEAPHVPA